MLFLRIFFKKMNLWIQIKRWFNRDEQIDASMKYLVVGLGNMGGEYENTRHNIGFDVVDALAQQLDCPFESEHLGDLAHGKYKGRHIYLLKPSTFMNLSGKAVRYWVQKLQIRPSQWLVVVDEIQFDLGTVRMQKKGSAGGHNGLQNIQNLMQTISYPRLRIGIGRNFGRGQQVDYVLGKWSSNESEKLDKILQRATEMVLAFASIGLDQTMAQFNKKSLN